MAEWRRLIIILFAYWEVASIIFLGLHDKLQIANVINAILNLFCICFFSTVNVALYKCVCMLACASYTCCKMNWVLFVFCMCDYRDGCHVL